MKAILDQNLKSKIQNAPINKIAPDTHQTLTALKQNKQKRDEMPKGNLYFVIFSRTLIFISISNLEPDRVQVGEPLGLKIRSG